MHRSKGLEGWKFERNALKAYRPTCSTECHSSSCVYAGNSKARRTLFNTLQLFWGVGVEVEVKYCAFYLLAFDIDSHFSFASGTQCAGKIRQNVGQK